VRKEVGSEIGREVGKEVGEDRRGSGRNKKK
jgi:hypothetical protein